METCGRAACPPRPSISIVMRSAAAISGPICPIRQKTKDQNLERPRTVPKAPCPVEVGSGILITLTMPAVGLALEPAPELVSRLEEAVGERLGHERVTDVEALAQPEQLNQRNRGQG